MFRRLLLDPAAAPTDGAGGGGGNPAATDPTPATPASSPATGIPPEFVTEFRAMQGRLQQLETAEQQRAAAASEQATRTNVERGQADPILDQHRQEVEQLQRQHNDFIERARSREIDRALTEALAGHRLAKPAAVAQLVALWRGDFEAVDAPTGGDFVVRARGDLRSPAQIVAERLGSPDWDHYLAPQGTPGQATGQRPAPTATPANQTTTPATTGQPMSDWLNTTLAARRASADVPPWLRR